MTIHEPTERLGHDSFAKLGVDSHHSKVLTKKM